MTTSAAPELDVTHRQAVTRLEGAFAELMAEFRRFFAQAAETAAPGMLPATFKVLSAVDRFGPVTVSALAERFTADKGQMSRAVSELEDRGFVERSSDPSDGRVRMIAVTPLGHERADAGRRPYEQTLSANLRDWPVESIETLSDLIRALISGSSPTPAADPDFSQR